MNSSVKEGVWDKAGGSLSSKLAKEPEVSVFVLALGARVFNSRGG
jgi:hypothetical protein